MGGRTMRAAPAALSNASTRVRPKAESEAGGRLVARIQRGRSFSSFAKNSTAANEDLSARWRSSKIITVGP